MPPTGFPHPVGPVAHCHATKPPYPTHSCNPNRPSPSFPSPRRRRTGQWRPQPVSHKSATTRRRVWCHRPGLSPEPPVRRVHDDVVEAATGPSEGGRTRASWTGCGCSTMRGGHGVLPAPRWARRVRSVGSGARAKAGPGVLLP
jgi:hypothetical protein